MSKEPPCVFQGPVEVGSEFFWNKDFDVETWNQPNLVGHKKQQNMQSNSSLVVELNQPFFEKKTLKSNWCSFFSTSIKHRRAKMTNSWKYQYHPVPSRNLTSMWKRWRGRPASRILCKTLHFWWASPNWFRSPALVCPASFWSHQALVSQSVLWIHMPVPLVCVVVVLTVVLDTVVPIVVVVPAVVVVVVPAVVVVVVPAVVVVVVPAVVVVVAVDAYRWFRLLMPSGTTSRVKQIHEDACVL